MGGRLPGILAGTAIGLALMAAPAGAATIHVTTVADELAEDGDCSLREAVESANDNASFDQCERGSASADTVRLENGEQYELTIPSTNEAQNANGDLDFTGGGPLTLRGNHRSIQGSGIEAPADDRVIEATNDADALTVSHLNLTGGDVSPLLPGDAVGGSIKAIAVPLTVEDINLEGGKADKGGGIYASVFDDNKVKISDAYLADSAATESGGLIHIATAKSVELANVGMDGNEVVGQHVRGGAMWTNAKTTVADSDFQFNEARTTFSTGTAYGGAIYSEAGKLTITGSTFSSDDALDVAGSSSSRGGAIYSSVGRLDVSNSTFFRNETDGRGGAIYAFGDGGVSFATFTENEADDSGDAIEGASEIKLTASIFDGAGFDNCATADFISKGYNVYVTADAQCGFGGKDALITGVGFADGIPLNNGGPTFTMSLLKESAARNVMPKGKCKDVTRTDQRGYKRPGGKKCDAGAFERGAKP